MYIYTEIYTKILSPTFVLVSKFDVKFGVGSKFSNLHLVADFSIFWSKSSHVQVVILKIGYFSFFNLRLGTYNVPSGSSATSLTTSAKRELFYIQPQLTHLSYILWKKWTKIGLEVICRWIRKLKITQELQYKKYRL